MKVVLEILKGNGINWNFAKSKILEIQQYSFWLYIRRNLKHLFMFIKNSHLLFANIPIFLNKSNVNFVYSESLMFFSDKRLPDS